MTAADLQAFTDKLRAHPALEVMRLHRIYYYDAEPLSQKIAKPLNGGTVDFSNSDRAQRQRSLHEELVRLPHYALRAGECTWVGWSVPKSRLNGHGDSVTITADDLRPGIAQKGVDMRIGMDIASLTLKKLVNVIVLVTGDSDFVPAMKFARREGAQLYLAPMGHSIRPSMHEHSDLVLDIT